MAPRQTKRIQKVEWSRSERNRRTESTRQADQENDSVVSDRDYQDTVSASLDEWSAGSSNSATEGVAGGIGFFAPPAVGGVGGGAGFSQSSSTQSGGRDTTASEHQRLRDSIRRHGDALRKFESTVVTEVSQEESVTGTTEVIRNINYAHSLTVIYYQILRHLKVTTEFAGVRQCLFVPFAIKPFDVGRAYRWRETLQKYMRSPLYSRGLRYLKDVYTNFSTSAIPAGSRARQPLTYLRGSMFITLGVERPHDTATGEYSQSQWQMMQPMLGMPSRGVHSTLGEMAASARDSMFQAAYAPTVAASWASSIQLQLANGRVLHADYTLASRYQFNRPIRVDFVVSLDDLGGITRESLQQLVVTGGLALPTGSSATLSRLALTYSTAKYEHTAEAQAGTIHLINPVTGVTASAMVSLPLDQWERVDERLEIRRSVNQLLEHLNEHVEYYHKAIWWRMDRDRLFMMLDGFYVPGTTDISIATIVDREPVGIIGNCMVYRIGAGAFIKDGELDTPEKLQNMYVENAPISDPLLISLPTDGLYAQAVMDECVALEEHFGNFDWALTDKDPDLGNIDPSLMLSRRADPNPGLTPTTMPNTIINLQNAP
ncbi:MAG: hypothetical protein ABUL49_01870, partial [bacterium]